MSKKTRNADRLILGAPPRADLLPPDLKIESKLRRERRGLVFIGILSVVAVVLAYGYTSFFAANSAIQLANANANTATLLAEQKKYADVVSLTTRLTAITEAQLLGVSTEIDWKDYLEKVQGSLPPGTTISSVSASTASPGSGLAAPSNPLGASSIAGLSFVANSPTLPDVSQWIDNLALLTGYADATAGSITLNQDGSYSVSIVMHINIEALANRFSGEAAAK